MSELCIKCHKRPAMDRPSAKICSTCFIAAVVGLLSDVELEPDEIDETLREFGYDPDALGKRFADAAQKAIEDRRIIEETPGL